MEYFAGSDPKGNINCFTRQLWEEIGYSVDKIYSKIWDEFANNKTLEIDFILTDCDQAAGEVSLIGSGKPIAAHWGFSDPALVH